MDYTKGRNLYVILNETPGFLNYLGTYISPKSASGECTSDWISVEGIESVTIQSWVPEIGDNQQTWIGYAFYSDKSLSENVSSRTAKYGAAGSDYLVYTGVSVPDGAKYLRVSYRHFNDGKCKVEIGNEATDWRPAPEDARMFEGGGGAL